jgi:hypothetical protein
VQQDVLADLAALGPFFAVHSHLPGAEPDPPWRLLRELAEQPEPLLGRIGSVRVALARRGGLAADEIGLRTAASVTHLGLAARLIAPALAAAVGGYRIDLRLGGLWWQDKLGGPVPLSVPEPRDDPGMAAGYGCRRFLDEIIAPITTATARLIPVSDHVLWGNVASGINSAASQVALLRPSLADEAWATASDFFSSPLLRRERQSAGPAFRRSSCCLIYRATPGRRPGQRPGVCADCVLRQRPAR